MSCVSNTGPLVALAKGDLLGLLQPLVGVVGIPPAVHRELLAKPGPEAQRLRNALGAEIRVAAVPAIPADVARATDGLGLGEQEAIALAVSRGALLLIDDRSGRTAARGLGIAVTGTIGVLLKAKQAGLIALIRPVLETMRSNGYYLSNSLIETAAKLAGE